MHLTLIALCAAALFVAIAARSPVARRTAIGLLVLFGLFPFFVQWGGVGIPSSRRGESAVNRRLWSGRTGAVSLREGFDPEEIREIARRAALRHGLDPALVQSMISVESGFDPLAESPRGAMGVMQLMPATASELGVLDPFDLHQNIEGGVRYLKRLLRRYGGDLPLALAAYNAGPDKVRRHRGVPPIAETRRYVQKVISRYRSAQEAVDVAQASFPEDG